MAQNDILNRGEEGRRKEEGGRGRADPVGGKGEGIERKSLRNRRFPARKIKEDQNEL